MNYLVANWKSNKRVSEIEAWFDEIQKIKEVDDWTMVVCPTFAHLSLAKKLVEEKNLPIALGAQDVSNFPFGKYTGAVCAEQIAEMSKYVIVGHSERRKYFHETHLEVAHKVERLIDNNLIPIVCVDTPYIAEQLGVIDVKYYSKIIVAYEPLAAIGSGQPDSPEHADEVSLRIEKFLGIKAPILYGGSVNAENEKTFLESGNINGFLVGNASLESTSFMAMVGNL